LPSGGLAQVDEIIVELVVRRDREGNAVGFADGGVGTNPEELGLKSWALVPALAFRRTWRWVYWLASTSTGQPKAGSSVVTVAVMAPSSMRLSLSPILACQWLVLVCQSRPWLHQWMQNFIMGAYLAWRKPCSRVRSNRCSPAFQHQSKANQVMPCSSAQRICQSFTSGSESS